MKRLAARFFEMISGRAVKPRVEYGVTGDNVPVLRDARRVAGVRVCAVRISSAARGWHECGASASLSNIGF
jgi:hypothetical protein